MSDDRQRRIEQRAHEIWQREGCPEGRADEHWRRATAEIEQEETAAAVSLASAAPAPQPPPEAAAKEAAEVAPKTTRATRPRSTIPGAKAETVKTDEPKKTVRKKK